MVRKYHNPKMLTYILECIIGLCICYAAYICFPQHQFYWSMVSVVLVIAPDSKDANRLAFDRMKANILGSSVGLLLFLIHQPNLFLICIGVVLTIAIGTFARLNSALRSALAALIIVMIHEKQQNTTWIIAMERMGCVMFGCITGLLITVIFNFRGYYSKSRNTKKVA